MHALLKGARLPVYAQRHSVTSGFLIRFPAKKSNFVSAELSQYASSALLLIFGLHVLSASMPIGVLGRALTAVLFLPG